MWQWLGITDDKKLPSQSEEELKKTETVGLADNVENKNVHSKVSADNLKEVAGNLGNYLYSFANVATKTATKLKSTVDEKLDKTIVGDFNRENEKFIQEKEARRIGDAVPPWFGYHEEETMKQQILALSDDERNFLRDPPSGVDYQFNIEQVMPIAMAALKEDENLKRKRFELVPKRITEERFWRNYFYRVSLIKQSTQLSTMADLEISRKSPTSSSSESLNVKGKDQESPNEDDANDAVESPANHEFASDAFLSNEEGLSEEEKNQMLGTDAKKETDVDIDDLEKELEAELETFELVTDNTDGVDGDGDWEQEIESMLDLDEDVEN